MSVNSIRTNTQAMAARDALSANTKTLGNIQNDISSGIDTSDASKQAIAHRMQAQQNGAMVATQNTAQATSMLQQIKESLDVLTEVAYQMRNKSVEASNGLLTSNDRTGINNDYQTQGSELTRQISSTAFNGTAYLTSSQTVKFQVTGNNDGSGNDIINMISVDFTDLTSDSTLSAVLGADLSTAEGAQSAISNLDNFIDTLSALSAQLSSANDRLDFAEKNLTIFKANNAASLSLQQDVDVPEKLSELQGVTALIDMSSAVLKSTGENQKRLADLARSILQ